MALITFALGIVAGLATFAFEDRAQQNARFRALEAANGVLEAARAMGWEELTPEWAASQRQTADPWLPEGEMTVKVEPDRELPALKRVTVTVAWQISAQRPPVSVELIGFFAKRSREEKS
jgi:hypothetical protein